MRKASKNNFFGGVVGLLRYIEYLQSLCKPSNSIISINIVYRGTLWQMEYCIKYKNTI